MWFLHCSYRRDILREKTELLQNCKPLYGYFKWTLNLFYQAWKARNTNWILELLLKLTNNGDRAFVIDSSGFRNESGNLWRKQKWGKTLLSNKASREFYKVHLALQWAQFRGYFLTPYRIHDSRGFNFL